jgi:hypothetical protein
MTSRAKFEELFPTTTAKLQFLAEEEVAKDVDQVLSFERQFSAKSMSVLVGCWRAARDSWERVMKLLPPGELRDSMVLELVERDRAMDKLADEAQRLLYAAAADAEHEEMNGNGH